MEPTPDDSPPIRFELKRLADYSPEAMLAEVRRIAALLPDGALTRSRFDTHAMVDSSTIIRKLGTWHSILRDAGVADRYSGRAVSAKMRTQPGKAMSDEEVLAEMRRLAVETGDGRTLTRGMFRDGSTISDALVVRRFGSWSKALESAGLDVRALGRRWTEDDYYENLLEAWTHHARQPTYGEMNKPPSKISNGAYAKRFGTWRGALEAFVERVNADTPPSPPSPLAGPVAIAARTRPAAPSRDDRSGIPLGLRYKILSRDRFRCVVCGRSPATDLHCKLHVDHVLPVARGGKTTETNLRACCSDCNLGKGARFDA